MVMFPKFVHRRSSDLLNALVDDRVGRVDGDLRSDRECERHRDHHRIDRCGQE
jgi:hypothetical protein